MNVQETEWTWNVSPIMSLLLLKTLLKVASTSPKDNFKVPLMTFKALQGLTLNAQSNLICLLVLYNSLILPQQENPSHSTNSTSMFLLQDFAFPTSSTCIVLPWISPWFTSPLPWSPYYSTVSLSNRPSRTTTYRTAAPSPPPQHFLLPLTALFISFFLVS